MKTSLLAFVMLLPACICVGAAGAAAFAGQSGWTWGWFLLAGYLMSHVKIRTGQAAVEAEKRGD